LAAPDREGPAGESAERSFLEAHAATKGRGGIKIPPLGRRWAVRAAAGCSTTYL